MLNRRTDRPSQTLNALAAWIGLLASGLAVLALGASPARAGGCDGVADYRDELVASRFSVVSETLLPGGLSEIELSFEVANLDIGDFAAASIFPELLERAEALGIEEVTRPAELGPLAPLAQAVPDVNLSLRLPTANVAALLAELEDGTLPVTVHADEHDVLAPDVQIVSWTSFEDGAYALARDSITPAVNIDPGPAPYPVGAEYGIVLVSLADGLGSIFDAFDGAGTLYVVPDGYLPSEVPEALHYARVVSVTKSDEEGTGFDASDGVTTWSVVLARTDGDALPSLYTSASFCTGTSTHIDLPVQASRLHSLDGDDTEPEARDGNPQAIPFNGIDMEAGVTLSGQLAGHVLKPSLELRLRDGEVRAAVDIDTDLSFTAELRAEAGASFAEEISLYDLCFPLPDLIAGPIPIGMNLQLAHLVGAEGDVSAGAIVGFQKSFRSGFTVGYDSRRSPGDRYFAEPRHTQPQPVEFTPPQLLDSTGVHLGVSTEVRTTLRVGAQYPICDTGAGAYLGARASGSLDVYPTQDPWWSLGHEAAVFAGLELQLLGIEIASYETDVEPFVGEGTLEATGPLYPGGWEAEAAPASAMATATATATATSGSIAEPPLVGEDERWGLAIDGVGVPNGIDDTTVTARADGGALLAAHERIPGRNSLIAVDRFGELEWNARYRSVRAPRTVIELPDATILVVGEPAWYARHAADGSVLASGEITATDTPGDALHCVVGAAAALEEAPGAFGFVAVGHHARNDVRQRDACAFRVDATGELVWARVYGESGAQQWHDVLAASDGRIVAVGEAEAGPDLFSLNNPVFVSLDAADGMVLWSRTLPMISRNAQFDAVAEAPDGTLFAAGATGRAINRTGAALFARIDPDGENAHHALVLQDELWDAMIPEARFEDGAGGDTPYDEIFDLVPVSGGFAFVGRTGLGADTAAWVGRINANLGVEWFRSFDGDDADTLDGIALGEGSLLVSGYSGSLASHAPEDDTQLWLMKLALEGGSELGTGSGLASRFLAPGIRDSSGDPAIVPDGLVAMDAPFIVTDALPDSFVTPIDDLLDDPNAICVTRLGRTGRESTLDACEPEPVPEPGLALGTVTGALLLAGCRRRRPGLRITRAS